MSFELRIRGGCGVVEFNYCEGWKSDDEVVAMKGPLTESIGPRKILFFFL